MTNYTIPDVPIPAGFRTDTWQDDTPPSRTGCCSANSAVSTAFTSTG